jgi:hypothetical protein
MMFAISFAISASDFTLTFAGCLSGSDTMAAASAKPSTWPVAAFVQSKPLKCLLADGLCRGLDREEARFALRQNHRSFLGVTTPRLSPIYASSL